VILHERLTNDRFVLGKVTSAYQMIPTERGCVYERHFGVMASRRCLASKVDVLQFNVGVSVLVNSVVT
jgi:hypothetical protein